MNNYNLYKSSRIISGIGDSLQDIAILAMIANLANSTLISGALVSINAINRIISSFFVVSKEHSSQSTKKLLINLNLLYATTTAIYYIFLSLELIDIGLSILIYEAVSSFIFSFYKIYQNILVKRLASTNKSVASLYTADNIVKISTSLLSAFLLLKLQPEAFLIINLLSFLLSAAILKNMTESNDMPTNKITAPSHLSPITTFHTFRKRYPSIMNIIFTMAICNFIYVSYSVLLQKTISIYSISADSIGLFKAVNQIFSIVFTYLAGILTLKKMNLKVCLVMATGSVLSLLCIFGGRIPLYIFLLLYYPFMGSGLNTYIQIIYTQNVEEKDIPSLHGIHNIICGIAVFSSGLIVPIMLSFNTTKVFFLSMSIIFVLTTFFALKFTTNNIEKEI